MADTRGSEPRLVLGSGSPRRRALLAELGVDFTVRVADVDERSLWSDDVAASARRASEAKFEALAAALGAGTMLLTADTLVAIGEQLLGKPVDRADARRMLAACSAAEVVVVTALSFGLSASEPLTTTVETTVVLEELTEERIDAYLATDAALDKAGALELQGAAAGFVERTDGCWSNVVGLPICAVAALLDLDPVGSSQADRCSGRWCGAGRSAGDG